SITQIFDLLFNLFVKEILDSLDMLSSPITSWSGYFCFILSFIKCSVFLSHSVTKSNEDFFCSILNELSICLANSVPASFAIFTASSTVFIIFTSLLYFFPADLHFFL